MQSLYKTLEITQQAIADEWDFLVHIFGPTDTLALVSKAILRSVLLLVTAVTMGSAIGVALGLATGLRPGSLLAAVASLVSVAGVLTPSFLLSLFAMLFLVQRVSPFLGFRLVLLSPSINVIDLRRLLAPSLVLSVRPLAFMTQITIGALAEVVYADYVRTAYAKGLPRLTVLRRHILPNIAVPLLTGLNSAVVFSLSSILIIEWLFNWTGAGYLLLEAVRSRDAVLVSYLLVLIGVILLMITAAINGAIRRIDPRMREMEASAS